MGKRKSRKVVRSKAGPKLDTEFDCPFCNGLRSVNISLDFKKLEGHLWCRVCSVDYVKSGVPKLSLPVDIYSDWLDECQAANSPSQRREYNSEYEGHEEVEEEVEAQELGVQDNAADAELPLDEEENEVLQHENANGLSDAESITGKRDGPDTAVESAPNSWRAQIDEDLLVKDFRDDEEQRQNQRFSSSANDSDGENANEGQEDKDEVEETRQRKPHGRLRRPGHILQTEDEEENQDNDVVDVVEKPESYRNDIHAGRANDEQSAVEETEEQEEQEHRKKQRIQ